MDESTTYIRDHRRGGAAREMLAKCADLIDRLERIRCERAVIYKTFVLTGLRKGELASLTV